ncbi:MAG: fatty acid desaturase [Candidatus Saccharimonadales bacterium]
MLEKFPDQLEAPAIALATASAMGTIMSGFLHRSETHHSVEYNKPIQQVGKFATWALSGMNAKEWEVVHLTHHAYTDSQPTDDEWSALQEQYPGAPMEAFRDPHSPIIEGHLNVFAKNAAMYRRSARAIMPYLRGLNDASVPRGDWPPHLANVDLAEDWGDKHIYNRKLAGVLGVTTLGLSLAAATDTKTAAKAIAGHIPLILGVGGLVNSAGHLGKTSGAREKLKVFLGQQPARPDENGSYASNFFTGYEAVTAGEGSHGDHHKNPGNAFLSSRSNILRDPTGVIISGLTRLKLRGRPLAWLPQAPQKVA